MLLLPWLVGGFLMSMTWAYITAHELVALLVSLGRILGVRPSVLGLTVLAWGNSVGDLVANVAMAVKGGRRGTQVVISGCYTGGHLRVLISLLRKGSVVVYLLHRRVQTRCMQSCRLCRRTRGLYLSIFVSGSSCSQVLGPFQHIVQ